MRELAGIPLQELGFQGDELKGEVAVPRLVSFYTAYVSGLECKSVHLSFHAFQRG